MGKESKKDRKSKDSFGVNERKQEKEKRLKLNNPPVLGLPEYMLPNK